jgi:hypothetical protein
MTLLAFAEGPPDDRSLDSVADRIGALLRKALVVSAAETAPAAASLRETLDTAHVDWLALQQALQLDLAHRIAFQAAVPRVAQPVPQLSDVSSGTQVSVNPTLSVLRLTHDVQTEGAPELPLALHVAVVRSVDGVRTDALDPVFARLLTLSRSQTLGQARENVARSVDAALSQQIDSTLDAAINLAFERNYWLGIRAV